MVPVFIIAPLEEQHWSAGAASRWWLHHSLAALAGELKKRGSQLIVQRGPSLPALRRILQETAATLVCWNKLYEPAALKRDAAVAAALEQKDVTVEQCNSTLLFPPGAILNGQQLPYRVFTPFWRTVEKELATLPAPVKAPRKLPPVKRNLTRISLDDLQLLPKIAWDDGIAQAWTPGENGALRQFKRFGKHIAAYPLGRDRPDLRQTSRLSPHLHFGEIGPRQIVAALRHPAAMRTWRTTHRAGNGPRDAAPYYRIFNPVLQAERFDPQRRYIRQWLPEIARLPDRWIHQPWAAPEETLQRAGIQLGITYPRPLIDLRESRKRALQAYSELTRL